MCIANIFDFRNRNNRFEKRGQFVKQSVIANNDKDHLLQQKKETSLKNLRIADVELFITAAHMKNLGKAAAVHHLSQSAASTAIQRVEAAFSSPLSAHEKRQFCLTREEQILLPRLENWIDCLRGLVIAADQVPIRLVTTHAIAQIALPALLSIDPIEFKYMRLDHAYTALLHGEADIALVLDNAAWKDVVAIEIGRGSFQLYSSDPHAPIKPVLLPEDQMEVLSLQQSWRQEALAPLAGGGALAVVAPPAGAPAGFQNVWVVDADGALEAATPIEVR